MFIRERIADFDIFDRHADTVLTKLKDRLQEGYSVDIQVRHFQFTLTCVE